MFEFGLLVSGVWWLLASVVLVPIVASHKRHTMAGWAVASLLFSPLLALIALAGIPERRA